MFCILLFTFVQSMFGMMDVGLGMGMMDMGAMQMQVGAMDMMMGNPIMGAQMMGLGAMQMGAGMAVADIGMMEMGMGGIGMMGAGMMGAGMMGAGMMGAGMMNRGMMNRGMMNRGIGFCAPGCMGPCCVTKTVVYQNGPPRQVVNQVRNGQYMQQMPQYQQNNIQPQQIQQNNIPPQQIQQNNIPPQQIQQNNIQNQRNQVNSNQNNTMTPIQGVSTTNADIQQQIYIQKQLQIQRIRKQQLRQKINIQKQKLKMQRNQIDRQKRQLQIKRLQQQAKYQKNAQNIVKKQQNNQSNQSNQIIPTNEGQSSPYIQNQQQNIARDVLFFGNVGVRTNYQWAMFNGEVTYQSVMNQPVYHITKIKVKAQSPISNARLVKITIKNDAFYAVNSQQQCGFMCAVFHAKLASMGIMCNPGQLFQGHLQAQILRKTYWSQWTPKFAILSQGHLSLSDNPNSNPNMQITGVEQIWSRFEIVRNMLVVKMHVDGWKNQLGIPLDNVMAWLKGLHTLIR